MIHFFVDKDVWHCSPPISVRDASACLLESMLKSLVGETQEIVGDHDDLSIRYVCRENTVFTRQRGFYRVHTRQYTDRLWLYGHHRHTDHISQHLPTTHIMHTQLSCVNVTCILGSGSLGDGLKKIKVC